MSVSILSLSHSLVTTTALFVSTDFVSSGYFVQIKLYSEGLLCVISFSCTFPRFLHVIACISTSFLFTGKYNSIAWVYYSLLIPSLVGEHLSTFALQWL